jgi:hypothetical protein
LRRVGFHEPVPLMILEAPREHDFSRAAKLMKILSFRIGLKAR